MSMLNSNQVKAYFNALPVKKTRDLGDYAEAPAALPDVSLNFLIELCATLNLKRVFEFGSGRSTKALLEGGCSVISLEDSDFWMEQTLKTLTLEQKNRHTALVRPLETRPLGLFPVLDWPIDAVLTKDLKEAELILVDSPYYTPFRESTL